MPILKNESAVEAFIKLETQLQSSRKEIAELSKKKPNDGVNKFKLGHLNAMLRSANKLLSADPPLQGFTEFDVDQVPSNSDVLFVLAQYTDAIYRFRERNTHYEGGSNVWKLSDARVTVAADSLHKFKYRE
jgi:hypothetical protein